MADRTSLKLEGGPELVRCLSALSLAVQRKTLIKILRRAAEPIRQRMATGAPRGGKPTIGPNGEPLAHLADSIVVSVAQANRVGGYWLDEQAAAVTVGPDRDHHYGMFLEYGTAKMGAHQFMRPAFDTTAVPVSLPMIQEDIWEAIAEMAERTSFKIGTSAVMGGPGGGGLL